MMLPAVQAELSDFRLMSNFDLSLPSKLTEHASCCTNQWRSPTHLECHINPLNCCAGFPTTACLVGHPPMFKVTATSRQKRIRICFL